MNNESKLLPNVEKDIVPICINGLVLVMYHKECGLVAAAFLEIRGFIIQHTNA